MNPARPIPVVPSTARKLIVLVPQVQLETKRAGNLGVSNMRLSAPYRQLGRWRKSA